MGSSCCSLSALAPKGVTIDLETLMVDPFLLSSNSSFSDDLPLGDYIFFGFTSCFLTIGLSFLPINGFRSGIG